MKLKPQLNKFNPQRNYLEKLFLKTGLMHFSWKESAFQYRNSAGIKKVRWGKSDTTQ